MSDRCTCYDNEDGSAITLDIIKNKRIHQGCGKEYIPKNVLISRLTAELAEAKKEIERLKEEVDGLIDGHAGDKGTVKQACFERDTALHALAARDVIIGDMREALEERISIEGTWQEWAEQVSIGQIKDFIQMIADATQRKIKDKALKGVVRG